MAAAVDLATVVAVVAVVAAVVVVVVAGRRRSSTLRNLILVALLAHFPGSLPSTRQIPSTKEILKMT